MEFEEIRVSQLDKMDLRRRDTAFDVELQEPNTDQLDFEQIRQRIQREFCKGSGRSGQMEKIEQFLKYYFADQFVRKGERFMFKGIVKQRKQEFIAVKNAIYRHLYKRKKI